MRKMILMSLSLLGALLILLVFTASLALSSDASPSPAESRLHAPPGTPATYWGLVLPAAPDFVPVGGMPVTALINDHTCVDQDYYTTDSGGQIYYLIKVRSGGECGDAGLRITFWVGTQVMTPTSVWPGEGSTVELNLGPADVVYADPVGSCDNHTPCFTRTQSAIDGVLTGGSVYVYPGTYANTTLNKNVMVTNLGDIALPTLNIQMGTFIAPSGALSVSGGLVHSGGTFNHNNGRVIFNSPGTQAILGDIAFHDVVVSSGTTVETTYDVTVSGVCTHGANSTTRETKDVGGTDPLVFALAGATITPNVQGSLSKMEVTRVEQNHAEASAPVQTGRYWSIAYSDPGYYSATMTLPHNETPDDQDRVCRHEGAGQWNCAADSYDVGRQTITRQNITQFSDWATGNDVPTAVALASFTATPQDNAVLLRWETASEIDALGFNLYRSEAPGGTYTCLNATLIPAQVPGTPSGAVYTWLDWQVEPHAVYYYRLESLDTHGQRMFYGPLEATTAAAMQWHAYLPLLLQDAP